MCGCSEYLLILDRNFIKGYFKNTVYTLCEPVCDWSFELFSLCFDNSHGYMVQVYCPHPKMHDGEIHCKTYIYQHKTNTL